MKQYTDPNELMKLPFVARQFRWRWKLELGQLVAKLTYRPFGNCFDTAAIKCFLPDRGKEIADTAVTTGQREVLLAALKQTEQINLPIVEVGAWRGATTAALADATSRTIYAVDPFNNYPEAASDMEIMLNRTRSISQVKHIRLRSGGAAKALAQECFSFVFIDAIHDYINTWFDFLVWERLLAPGGMLVFHDVDDHVGTNLACRRIRHRKNYTIWGYCPNLVAFEKVQDA
ncbi:MAG: class I SAM-dependent methyltransferase [Verrucomicrobiota bacterium]|jgi:predicted O-methyltransferase YrrM